jgi:UDP-glucuronate 4-epimerase
LLRGDEVVGIDNLNDYYSVDLKNDRLASLTSRFSGGFTFHRVDFSEPRALQDALKLHRIDRVVHLGAQAGVRYSLVNPEAYVRTNVVGHMNLLEFCRHHRACDHFVYGSSSSVYGSNEKLPFSVGDRVDHPVSLYAATKKSAELMSESYSHLYRMPQTGLRHHLWSVGATGHGDVDFHQGDSCRRANSDFQQRGHAPRLHIYR